MSKRQPKLKTFRVLCAVTRGAWYEIDAPDEDTAWRTAYSEGELIDDGKITDVAECEIQEVRS